LLGHINQVLHNRDLALFYADHDMKLDEALALAHKEFEVRHDIYTWDALAWALYKNGKYQEASDAIENALRPGVRDALLFFHAGMIAKQLGQNALAKERLQVSLSINPRFHVIYASVAMQQLKLLQDQPGLTASEGENHVR
jgi:tetratricopeptide (TPR) repeat protein